MFRQKKKDGEKALLLQACGENLFGCLGSTKVTQGIYRKQTSDVFECFCKRAVWVPDNPCPEVLNRIRSEGVRAADDEDVTMAICGKDPTRTAHATDEVFMILIRSPKGKFFVVATVYYDKEKKIFVVDADEQNVISTVSQVKNEASTYKQIKKGKKRERYEEKRPGKRRYVDPRYRRMNIFGEDEGFVPPPPLEEVVPNVEVVDIHYETVPAGFAPNVEAGDTDSISTDVFSREPSHSELYEDPNQVPPFRPVYRGTMFPMDYVSSPIQQGTPIVPFSGVGRGGEAGTLPEDTAAEHRRIISFSTSPMIPGDDSGTYAHHIIYQPPLPTPPLPTTLPTPTLAAPTVPVPTLPTTPGQSPNAQYTETQEHPSSNSTTDCTDSSFSFHDSFDFF